MNSHSTPSGERDNKGLLVQQQHVLDSSNMAAGVKMLSDDGDAAKNGAASNKMTTTKHSSVIGRLKTESVYHRSSTSRLRT